ncbi:MAG: AAA family ATPase [Chloroflexi bacterium]|nr:AAA family ATPase [Chloroflexota bacterium]
MSGGFELQPAQLRRVCDPSEVPPASSSEVPPLTGPAGQERAARSIEFALGLKAQGFNLFVAGPAGTGRDQILLRFVKEFAAREPVPRDWVYVYNFSDQDRPLAISLPPSLGKTFAQDMADFIDHAQEEIPRAFESEEYEKRKSELLQRFEHRKDEDLAKLQRDAESRGFMVQVTQSGIMTIPIIRDRPMTKDEFDLLPDDKREAIQEKSDVLQAEVNELLREVRQMEKQAREEVQTLDKEIVLFAVGHLLDRPLHVAREHNQVVEHLTRVEEDIADHVDDYKAAQKPAAIPGFEFLARKPSFDRYKVNLFVNNEDCKGAPVVLELNPSYYNLFGKLEYKAEMGGMSTDFSMLKPGAIHRANGGYLILHALDVLLNPLSWDALKRTIRGREARIENIGEQYRAVPAATLKPEPIPVTGKVVLIGDLNLYSLLYHYDPEFRKLFKVKADFNIDMDRNHEHVEQYLGWLSRTIQEVGLKPFTREGMAKVVEYGSWLAGDQEKLSTRFLEVGDLVVESSYWASVEGVEEVSASHVKRAVDEKTYRSNMIEERIREMIEEGTIFIATEGSVAGQINGLSVSQIGDYMFGQPNRITCRVRPGKKGVVDIQRETKMSGPIHQKGVFTLAGYLEGKFAADVPLSLDASLSFEQLYSGVEGDSASSTELYALISALAEVPISQQVAVTGSVNQQGEVQPIGGVNAKIEGYYAVCKVKGLTGSQGVMIPKSNAKNLMLKEEIIDAVKAGQFHIWAVSSIDEGVEVLTGRPAGHRTEDGKYELSSVNYLVDKKLRDFADRMKEYEAAA